MNRVLKSKKFISESFNFSIGFSTATSDVIQKDGTLRTATNESEHLRKQIASLQRYKENNSIENRFVSLIFDQKK
jgi:hypothetical protein